MKKPSEAKVTSPDEQLLEYVEQIRSGKLPELSFMHELTDEEMVVAKMETAVRVAISLISVPGHRPIPVGVCVGFLSNDKPLAKHYREHFEHYEGHQRGFAPPTPGVEIFYLIWGTPQFHHQDLMEKMGIIEKILKLGGGRMVMTNSKEFGRFVYTYAEEPKRLKSWESAISIQHLDRFLTGRQRDPAQMMRSYGLSHVISNDVSCVGEVAHAGIYHNDLHQDSHQDSKDPKGTWTVSGLMKYHVRWTEAILYIDKKMWDRYEYHLPRYFSYLSEEFSMVYDPEVRSYRTHPDQVMVKILLEMENEGLYVGRDRSVISDKFTQLCQEYAAEAYAELEELAGEPFSWRSRHEVARIVAQRFNAKGLKGSLAADDLSQRGSDRALEKWRGDEFVDKLLAFRRWYKHSANELCHLLVSVSSGGRIYPDFELYATPEGHSLPKDPWLRELTAGSSFGLHIRQMISTEDPRFMLLSASYKALPWQVLAHDSGDVNLELVFLGEEELDQVLAGSLFGVPTKDLTYENIMAARQLLHLFMNPVPRDKLFKGPYLKGRTRKQWLDGFYHLFSKVGEYMRVHHEISCDLGHCITWLDRSLFHHQPVSLKDYYYRRKDLSGIKCIMASALELHKMAAINIARKLRSSQFESRLIFQENFELLFEVPMPELDPVREIIGETMEGISKIKALKVEIGVGRTWFEASAHQLPRQWLPSD